MFIGKGGSAVGGRLFKTAVMFIKGAVMFIGGAIISVGEGSSAIGRLFKTTRAELYYCWACGGLYGLSCYKSLALAKGEGETSRAYMGGACADRVYIDRACINRAYINRACADRAYINRAAC